MRYRIQQSDLTLNATEFDEKNPWHANAHLVFGFQCHRCDKTLGYEQVPVGDFGGKFLEYCVAVSNAAQSQGWVCDDEFKFLCGSCSANKV
jgi:hypothetical protein